VTGIWGDRDISGKQLSSPDPDGLIIAAQRGVRDFVSGDKRANRIKSRIQFACKFARLSRDVRATRIGGKEAPTKAFLIEKSKKAELPDEWIYSGENPWFPTNQSSLTNKPTCVKLDDVPDFMRSYVSLVIHVDLAHATMGGISRQFIRDSWDFDHNTSMEDFLRIIKMRNYALILAAANGYSHPWTDVDKIKVLISRMAPNSANLVSKWLPFFGQYEKADLVMGDYFENNMDFTHNVPLTMRELSTAAVTMDYVLDLIDSGRDNEMNLSAPTIRKIRDKISSAFNSDKLDDSMLGKHRRERSKKR
jgi:hypothetical protein